MAKGHNVKTNKSPTNPYANIKAKPKPKGGKKSVANWD